MSTVPSTDVHVAPPESTATAGPAGLRAPMADVAPPPRRVVRGTTTVELYYDGDGSVRLRRWEGVGLVPGPTPTSDPLCLFPHMTLKQLVAKDGWAIEIRADVLKNINCKLLSLQVRGTRDAGAFLVPIYRDAVKGTTDGVTVYFTAPMHPRTNHTAAIDIELRCVEP
jgi:hypothetical protein